MFKFTFCPALSWRSFVVIISIVELLVFMASIAVSIIKYNGLDENTFLGPKIEASKTFSDGNTFGFVDIYPYGIKNDYQIWRLVTPLFFNTGFMTFGLNTILQLVYGSYLEQVIGFKQTAATYLVSSLGGIFLSNVATPENVSGLGPAAAIQGLLTGQLAVLFVHWDEFSGD